MRKRWTRVRCNTWRHVSGAEVHAIESKSAHHGLMAPRYYRAVYGVYRAEAREALTDAMEIAESMALGREGAA